MEGRVFQTLTTNKTLKMLETQADFLGSVRVSSLHTGPKTRLDAFGSKAAAQLRRKNE